MLDITAINVFCVLMWLGVLQENLDGAANLLGCRELKKLRMPLLNEQQQITRYQWCTYNIAECGQSVKWNRCTVGVAPRLCHFCDNFIGFYFFEFRPYFIQKNSVSGPVTCTVNGVTYAVLLRKLTVSSLQQRYCLCTS